MVTLKRGIRCSSEYPSPSSGALKWDWNVKGRPCVHLSSTGWHVVLLQSHPVRKSDKVWEVSSKVSLWLGPFPSPSMGKLPFLQFFCIDLCIDLVVWLWDTSLFLQYLHSCQAHYNRSFRLPCLIEGHFIFWPNRHFLHHNRSIKLSAGLRPCCYHLLTGYVPVASFNPWLIP